MSTPRPQDKTDELLAMIQALVEADPTNQSPIIKLSKHNCEILGRPLTLFNREVIPHDGFPDERIYLTATR